MGTYYNSLHNSCQKNAVLIYKVCVFFKLQFIHCTKCTSRCFLKYHVLRNLDKYACVKYQLFMTFVTVYIL